MSDEVWALALNNGRNVRPVMGAKIGFDLSGLSEAEKSVFAEVVSLASVEMGGRVFYKIAGPADFVVPVRVIGTLMCGTVLVESGACTSVTETAGRVNGGEILFTHSQGILYDRPMILKEVLRLVGVFGNSPRPGLFAQSAWAKAETTPEEHAMLLGKFEIPFVALGSPAPN